MEAQAKLLRRVVRSPRFIASLCRTGSGSVASTMLRGSGVSLILSVGGTGLGLIATLLLARLLGPVDYGNYAIAVGWAMLFGIPVTFGMDFVILRFVPAYAAKGQWQAIRYLLGFSGLIILGLSALATLFLFVIDTVRPNTLGSLGSLVVAIIVLIMASQAGLTVYSAFFRAIRSIFFSQLYLQIARPFFLLSAVALLAAAGTITPSTGLAATGAASLLALLFLAIHLKFSLPTPAGSGRAGLPAGERRRWLDMAWPSLLSASMQQALMQGGIVALGLLGAPEEAGYYAVASRLAVLATFPLSALSSITAPMIVEAWIKKDRARLQSVATLNARLSFAGAVAVLLLFALFGSVILDLFGEGYTASLVPLLILCGGSLIVALTGACANLLLMTGHQRAVAGTMVGGICVFIAILAMTSRDGIASWEAASAYAVAISVTNLTQTVLSARWLAVNATAL